MLLTARTRDYMSHELSCEDNLARNGSTFGKDDMDAGAAARHAQMRWGGRSYPGHRIRAHDAAAKSS